MYGLKVKNDNTMKNFKGLIQKLKQEHSFIYLKLMECEEKDSGDGHLRSSQFPHLSCFKEFDLLLLSETEIDTKNIKKMSSSNYLKEV